MGKKVYAIREGYDFKNNKKIENKIVNTWAECLSYVKGVKNAKYKSFTSSLEANEYLFSANRILNKSDDNYPKDCLNIYVDGSYSIETQEYSYGLCALKGDTVMYIDSGKGTNALDDNIRQIAGELKAAMKAAEYALSLGEKKVVIIHDYVGICYHATGEWERKGESSKIYYQKMNEIMDKGLELIFVKVDSHTGDLFNELVDEKCKELLNIPSDRTVEKTLKKQIIKVANQTVKDQITTIAPNGSDKIVVVDENGDAIQGLNNVEPKQNIIMNEIALDTSPKDDYKDLREELISEINKLSRDKHGRVLKYLKRVNKE